MPHQSNRSARYEEYIRSAAWKAKRKRALDRACHRCQICNGATALDVHHRTYERFGNERLDDLTVLCRKCHDLFHATGRKTQRERKHKRKDGPARKTPKKIVELTAENNKLAAMQAANRERQEAARAAREFRPIDLSDLLG